MKLEELHNCKKCQGKIVAISVDKLGISRCSYCNEVVDYAGWFKEQQENKFLKIIKEHKND